MHCWRLLLVPLGALLLLAPRALAAEHGLGARSATPEEQEAFARICRSTPVVPNALSFEQWQAARLAHPEPAPRSPGLPAAVDNSSLGYFPPIGDQGRQNSCVAWAVGYYLDTYVQARDEGRDVSGGDPTLTCSPAFLYPLINFGLDDGASMENVFLRLRASGCATLTDCPWSEGDYTTWPAEAAWVNALRNRPSEVRAARMDDDYGQYLVKQSLANGDVGVIRIMAHSAWYSGYPADGPAVNSGVYHHVVGSEVDGHALTVVGYDDAKSYVDSRDGLTHYGAFLVANSWGGDWGVGNTLGVRGFMWMAYDLFKEAALWSGGTAAFYTLTDLPRYRLPLYAVVGVNHPDRWALQLGWYGLLPTDRGYVLDNTPGGDLPIDDTRRVALDLSSWVYTLTPEAESTVGVTLGVSVYADDPGTLTSADFYEDLDGDGTYQHVASPDPPLAVAPDTRAMALAVLQPPTVQYQVVREDLPSQLVWDVTSLYDPVICNLTAVDWKPADEFRYQDTDPVDRWAFFSSVQGSGPSMGWVSTPCYITAPPVTTLLYSAGAGGLTAAGVGTLPLRLVPSLRGLPLVGQTLARDVVISRFPDDQPFSTGGWARTQIEECAGRVPRIVGGYPDGYYRPTVEVSRDQMAVYIQRSLVLPTAPYQGLFPDIASDSFGAAEIEALVGASIVGGYPDGKYSPATIVNRGQMAAFISRSLAGSDGAVPTPTGTAVFPDVPEGNWYRKYVEYCVDHSIVAGYPDGKYWPELAVNRGQMAVFVYRAFLQPTGAPIVLAGPAVTAQDPETGGACGWTSADRGPAAAPGYAYVAFDGARLGRNLAAGGTWDVTLELRRASDPDTPATGLYTTTVSADALTLAGLVTAARTTGDPYHVVFWELPSGLAPDDYRLVVTVEDERGAKHEVARRPAFTITP